MKLLGIAGSLRPASYNRRLLDEAAQLLPEGVELVRFEHLREIPPFDEQDREASDAPAPVVELREAIREADGVLFATPEYNGSIPGAMKNLIDWVSRANGDLKTGECFRGKIAAITTASPGAFGGIRCLAHLRDVLTILLVNTLPTEIAVAKVGAMFDGDSDEITNDVMRGTLEDLGKSLADTLKKTHGEIETYESDTSDVSSKQ